MKSGFNELEVRKNRNTCMRSNPLLIKNYILTTRSHIYKTPRLLTEMVSLTTDNQIQV